jgi:hypothetical protein
VSPDGILGVPPGLIVLETAIIGIRTVYFPRMLYAVGLYDVARAHLGDDTSPATPFYAALRLRRTQITTYAIIFVCSLSLFCMEPTVEPAIVLNHSVSVTVCNAAHHF